MILYLVIFLLAIAPGLPIGVLLFGRRHAGAWIVGGLIGYGLTQLALWAVIVSSAPSLVTFVLAWAALLIVVVALCRLPRTRPLLQAPWTRADRRALLVVLLLVPLLVGTVYRNLGRADETGARYYRAYFTADFLWHCALTYELGKFSLPPRNPYMAPRVMNYYWTYFLLPAAVAELAPEGSPIDDVERVLKMNAMLVGILMMGALFLLVRSASSALSTALAVLLATLAASAEGLYAIGDIIRRGRPWSVLLDTNVDAITAWEFGGLRIDNIPRSLWYTPQHTTSIALGLAALALISIAGAGAHIGAIAAAGLALGLATTMNPLLGAVCSAMYGAAVVVDVWDRPQPIRVVLRHALAALPVVLAVLWGSASRVADGAGSALDIGFAGFSRNWPIVTLLLSLGPVLIPALFGFLRPMHARRPVAIAAAGLGLGLFLLYFVRITELSWVGFRAGQILLVSIPILLARTFDFLRPSARWTLAIGILALGLPTTVVDTYNTQDISNRRPGPGFRWTLWTTSAQQEAFAWLRAHTPEAAVVQMEPMVRAREHWTLIPSFAGRRMAAGIPISLLPLPEYTERSEMVRTLFATTDPEAAAGIAHKLRIDYLYVDRDDVAAYPEGTRKFDAHPRWFERVFANAEVAIYRVR